MVFLLYNHLDMYESPPFDTIRELGNISLRRYKDFFTIAVTENSLQGYSGFGYLFQYISGQNHQGVKMKMTVPVINDLSPKEQTMEFVIPSQHHNAIPDPLYAQMRVKHYPAQLVVVYRFSGYVPQEKMNTITQKLTEFAEKENLKVTGDPKIARYNGPYTLPFLRRNEIWLTVVAADKFDKHHTK